MSFKWIILLVIIPYIQLSQPLSINGFTNWRTGHDAETVQLIPSNTDDDGLTKVKGKVVAHARFIVAKYGEMSFPINPETPLHTEALAVDLSDSKFIEVVYKANTDVILQLREFSIHGGVQNQAILPRSPKFSRRTIPLSSFRGGLTPLNLKNVAKFNFALLKNNPESGYADLIVKSFKIDNYNPRNN